MCAPLIGGIIAGIGSLVAARQQAAQARVQAQFHERQAAMERQRGGHEAKRFSDRARRLAGQQLANYAAAGLQIDGSPGMLIDDSAAEAALDVDAIRYGADARAENAIYRAQQSRANARRIRNAAPFAAIAPRRTGRVSRNGDASG